MPRYGVDFWREALASPALVGLGPYGPLGPPDIYGVRVPGGFRARVIGRSGRPITGTDHTWHLHPSDGATIATRDGGWVYVSNSQAGPGDGGASGIRFRQDGHVVDAYRVLDGTLGTRAGCRDAVGDVAGRGDGTHGSALGVRAGPPGQGQMYPLAGSFDHGALAVDPRTGVVYLCENDYDGRLYRYRPDIYGDLSSGVLEAAKVRRSGHVDWVEVSSKHPERCDATTGFHRTDGAWFADDALFITSADARCVWAIDVRANELSLIYDAATMPVDAPMREPGTVTVHERSGDILVAEYIDAAAAGAAGRRQHASRRCAVPASWSATGAARSPASGSTRRARACTSARWSAATGGAHLRGDRAVPASSVAPGRQSARRASQQATGGCSMGVLSAFRACR